MEIQVTSRTMLATLAGVRQMLKALKAGKLRFDNRVARIAALVKADGSPDTLQALRGLVATAECLAHRVFPSRRLARPRAGRRTEDP